MTTPSAWLNNLALLPDIDMQHWKLFKHEHHSQCLQQDTLAPTLSALGKVSGWLSEPSAITELRNQPITPSQLPLKGEFFSHGQSGESLQCWQLSHLGRGMWQLDSHVLQPCAADQANCLGERVQQLHANRVNAYLGYWRLWHPDVDQAPQCAIALLCTIDEIAQ